MKLLGLDGDQGFPIRGGIGEPTKAERWSKGNRYIGSAPLINLPDDPGHGAIRTLNPKTWGYKLHTRPWAGVLSAARQWVFGGSEEGHLFALDASSVQPAA